MIYAVGSVVLYMGVRLALSSLHDFIHDKIGHAVESETVILVLAAILWTVMLRCACYTLYRSVFWMT